MISRDQWRRPQLVESAPGLAQGECTAGRVRTALAGSYGVPCPPCRGELVRRTASCAFRVCPWRARAEGDRSATRYDWAGALSASTMLENAGRTRRLEWVAVAARS